jgi:hypothetical protein
VSNNGEKANQKLVKEAEKKENDKSEETNNSKKKIKVQMCFICKEKKFLKKSESIQRLLMLHC